MCLLMGCFVFAIYIVNQRGDSGQFDEDVEQLRGVYFDTPSHIGGIRIISLTYKESSCATTNNLGLRILAM